MATRVIILTILLVSLFSITAIAEEGTVCLDYYYGLDCPDCEEALKHLQILKLKHTQLEINEFEVYNDFRNAQRLESFFSAHSIPEASQGVPAVFIGQQYFIGLNPIKNLVEGIIEDNVLLDCPSTEAENVVGLVGEKSPHRVLDTLGLTVATPAALKDAFNPSMLALLLIFLTILLVTEDQNKMVRRGTLMVGSIYLAFLFIGLNLFTVLQTPVLSKIFTKIVAILAILYGLVQIKGFFSTWKIFFGKVSGNVEKTVQDVVNALLTPLGIFLIGFFSALLTLGESSEVLSILRMLTSNSSFRWSAFPLYLYHMFIVIIPLIALIAIVYLLRDKFTDLAKKKEPHDERKAEIWKKHLHKVFNVAANVIIVFIGLGLLLLG